jgi:hypothetical protein
MPIQTINLGSYANDGTGDDLRTAFDKVNQNFTLLNSEVGIGNGTNLGSGVGVFAAKDGQNLQFKTLTSTNGSVTITSTANTVDLASSSSVVTDTHPILGGDLDLHGYRLFDSFGGSDLQATVQGLDVPFISALLQLAISSNRLNIDLSPILNFISAGATPSDSRGYILDFGFITQNSTRATLDLGSFI